MRAWTWFLLATAVMAGPAAWPQPAPSASDSAKAAKDMTFYPAPAKAAGLAGQATVECSITAQLGPRDCVLVSAKPAHKGFGQAALRIVQATPDNPKVNIKPKKHKRITYVFSLKPPGIYPHPGEPFHIIVDPQYLSRPSQQELAAKYRKLANGPLGFATLKCTITNDGRATDCSVAEESEKGLGFGKAALEIVKSYKMKPGLVDGEQPKDGMPFLMTFNFGRP